VSRFAPEVVLPVKDRLERAVGQEVGAAMTDAPLNILIIAYACSPVRSGEHLLGWEWANRLAVRHRVTVLTSPARVLECAEYCSANLRLIAVEDSRIVFLRGLGRFGFYPYYGLWQRAAADAGRKLMSQERFDVLHQLTFHTCRFPNPLASSDIPFVWGPVAGLERIPPAMFPILGLDILFELLRAASNWLTPRLPSVRRALRGAHAVIVSNIDTMSGLSARNPRDYVLLPANAAALNLPPVEPSKDDALELVAVGNIVRIRAYGLVLEAISALSSADRQRIRFTFIGDGRDKARLMRKVRQLGLENVVRFAGQLSRTETLERMRRAHLLVFPSLRDSGGSSVCEAMVIGLPVLGFNLAGPGAMLAGGGGFLIEATSPRHVVEKIGALLTHILEERDVLAAEGQRATLVARRAFDWDARVARLEDIYLDAVRKRLWRGAHV
jgi:glycosyltransferase involved in cell wall biosynthesis